MRWQPHNDQEPRQNQPHRNEKTGPPRRGVDGLYHSLNSIITMKHENSPINPYIPTRTVPRILHSTDTFYALRFTFYALRFAFHSSRKRHVPP
jgi:hypothetical protein